MLEKVWETTYCVILTSIHQLNYKAGYGVMFKRSCNITLFQQISLRQRFQRKTLEPFHQDTVPASGTSPCT